MYADIAAQARRRTLRLIALVTVALVMVVGTILVAVDARRAPAPSLSAPTSSTVATASVSTRMPSPTGMDLTWTTVAGARVPVSATAGPRDTTGGRARGFHYDTLGAVLAAAHISVRLSPQAGPAVFGPTLREQVVGDSAAALGLRLAEDYEHARASLGLPDGEPVGRLYSTALGYQVVQDTSPTTVQLLIEGPGQGGTVLVALTVRTQWSGGDWRLVAPRGGVWDDDTALITDATGFIRFPPGG